MKTKKLRLQSFYFESFGDQSKEMGFRHAWESGEVDKCNCPTPHLMNNWRWLFFMPLYVCDHSACSLIIVTQSVSLNSKLCLSTFFTCPLSVPKNSALIFYSKWFIPAKRIYSAATVPRRTMLLHFIQGHALLLFGPVCVVTLANSKTCWLQLYQSVSQ